ncbi:MAG: hypothetical protein HQL87_15530 [Magnetococcales bacterium]|nr:hypothetical protein [Magnetococcales bacterium]
MVYLYLKTGKGIASEGETKDLDLYSSCLTAFIVGLCVYTAFRLLKRSKNQLTCFISSIISATALINGVQKLRKESEDMQKRHEELKLTVGQLNTKIEGLAKPVCQGVHCVALHCPACGTRHPGNEQSQGQ